MGSGKTPGVEKGAGIFPTSTWTVPERELAGADWKTLSKAEKGERGREHD